MNTASNLISAPFMGGANRAESIRETTPLSLASAVQAFSLAKKDRMAVSHGHVMALIAALQDTYTRDTLAAAIVADWRGLERRSQVMAGTWSGIVDWEDVNEAEAALAFLLEETPEVLRGALYTLGAFLYWYKGNRDAAEELLNLAFDAGDTSTLARMLSDALAMGTLPVVARDRARRYQPRMGAAWATAQAGL